MSGRMLRRLPVLAYSRCLGQGFTVSRDKYKRILEPEQLLHALDLVIKETRTEGVGATTVSS